MRGEQILDALEQVDEELLYEAQGFRGQRRKKSRWPLVSLAACLCLVVAGTVVAQLWRSPMESNGSVGEESHNQMETKLEHGSGGVYVPPLEANEGGNMVIEADVASFFTYQGRSYVACSRISDGSHLVGEKLGTSDGHVDEWTPESGYVEGSARGDFYAVNGYDPTHLLCMQDEEGIVTLYWNNNDITVKTGSDVLETVFHLSGQVVEAAIQGQTLEGGTEIAQLDGLHAWLEELCNTPAVSAEQANLTRKDIQGGLMLKKADGVTVHLVFYDGDYVKMEGLDAVCWQLDWTPIAQGKA